MSGHYYSYTEGNGPFHIWGEGRSIQMSRWDSKTQRIISAEPTMPECDGSLYSDRLWQWDEEKHRRLWAEHCTPHQWYVQTPEALSAYLSASLERPVKAIELWQYNHAASGFPIWLVFYRHLTISASEPS